MKHIIVLVAVLSLVAAFVTQDDKPLIQDAINETASISAVENAG